MELNFTRIRTVVLRYFYAHRRTPSSFFDFLYWPLIDIFLFGFIGVWFSTQQSPHAVASLMIGLVLWQVSFRTNLEISRNLIQELWEENLINFFATPITISEWLIGLMLCGFLAVLITIPYGTLLVYAIFGQNIFSIGFVMIPLIILLIMSGWVLGLFASAILIYYGQKIETMVWAMGWLPAPFCSVYYPLEVLPTWMQLIGKCLPMTYAFQAVRVALNTGTTSYSDIGISFALNIVYLIAAIMFFNHQFKKSKQYGLNV